MSKIIPNVPIELDKPRHLRMSFLAFAKFKEATGETLFQAMNKMDSEPEVVATAVWAGLLHEDPDVSLETIQDCVGPANLEYVQARFIEAFQVAMPDAKKTSKNVGSRPTGTG